jgi:AcrR family transcriptional regulator
MPAEARRVQLLDAALDIILRDGYGKVSIDAIARELDVTRPVVYNVFESLDALLSELLERQERRALEQIFATVGARIPVTNRAEFVDVIKVLVAMVASDPRTWTPIFCTTGDTPAVVSARIAADRELVRTFFRELIERTDVLRSDDDQVDVDILAHLLVAAGEYFGRVILETPDAVDADRLGATVGAMVFGAASRRSSPR